FLNQPPNFAGGERLDLEAIVGDLGDPFAEIFATAIERVERLRPACRQPPPHLRHRLCDSRRSDSARGKAKTARRQKFTTFHAFPLCCCRMLDERSRSLLSLQSSPAIDVFLPSEISEVRIAFRMAKGERQIKAAATSHSTCG